MTENSDISALEATAREVVDAYLPVSGLDAEAPVSEWERWHKAMHRLWIAVGMPKEAEWDYMPTAVEQVAKSWSADDWEIAISAGLDSGRLGIYRYKVRVSANHCVNASAFFVQYTDEAVY